ncbi:MAG: tetratricopeptide repeat protein [Bacteroidota bacterium]|nr:tetratricopeptide repeat protein [Bacteroidota bacterium]
MKLIFRLSILFFFTCSCVAEAQQVKADSIYNVYLTEKTDTGKVNHLINLFNAYKDINEAKGVSFAREALELSMRMKYNKGICLANLQVADYYESLADYPKAIQHYLLAKQMAEKEQMWIEVVRVNNGLGIIYSNQGRHELSLKYFLAMIRLAEDHKFLKRLGVGYNNVGITYKELGRYSKANEYYSKALKEFERTNFVRGIASVTNNMGTVYRIQGDYEKALDYYEKARQSFRSINDTIGESGLNANIGEVYYSQGNYKKALEYYLKGKNQSEKYGQIRFINDSYEGLSRVYAKLGSHELAYSYLKKNIALKDSLNDDEGMRQVQEMEKRMDNEKKEKEIEILKQKEEIQTLKVKTQSESLKRSNLIIFSVAGILLVVLGMSFFIYKAYKQIKQTNTELGQKKKEIQDSINYAKNIQEAMLPDVSLLKGHFSQGFGLYLPKDVVSGDFYWFGELNDIVYFAVVDCTGHGVPGAFMSMIGIDKLNHAAIDKKLEKPSEILSYLNISVKKALKQSSQTSGSKDGMDMAICSYNSKTRQLSFAGANRPLWILRNKTLLEYKGTKASIAGYTDDDQVYEEHSIQMEQNDSIYLFTDGFADQFGGVNKKKFMTRQLKQTFVDLHHLHMSEQEKQLQKFFNSWKEGIEQVDDVLVLGFKV